MPKIDIKLIKRSECDFHGNGTGAPLWGILLIIPVPELGAGKTVEIFICECCLKQQMAKIQDKSYMETK